MRRFLCLLVASLILCAACGGGGHPSASVVTPATGTLPPVTAAPATTVPATTTTTTIDVAVVPARITVAYVTAVLKVLNHVYGNAVRAAVRRRRLTIPAMLDLAAIYTVKQAQAEQIVFTRALSSEIKQARKRPGDPQDTVLRLVSVSRNCVVAHVSRNVSPALKKSAPPLRWDYIKLLRARRVTKLNSATWVISADIAFSQRPRTVPFTCGRS